MRGRDDWRTPEEVRRAERAELRRAELTTDAHAWYKAFIDPHTPCAHLPAIEMVQFGSRDVCDLLLLAMQDEAEAEPTAVHALLRIAHSYGWSVLFEPVNVEDRTDTDTIRITVRPRDRPDAECSAIGFLTGDGEATA